jgi:hypothetical protein
MSEGPEWFSAKRYGYGSGLPIAWQGWVLLGFYLIAMIAGSFLLAPDNIMAFIALALTMTVMFVVITARTTRGGWKWRWGNKE